MHKFKRFLSSRQPGVTFCAVIAGVGLLGGAKNIFAEQTDGAGSAGAAEAQCYKMESEDLRTSQPKLHVPAALTYTERSGISIRMERMSSSGDFKYDAILPLTIDGDPNPDFDRLYALLLKGFDGDRITQICLAGVPAAGATIRITGISLRPIKAPEVQKVAVCSSRDPDECTTVLGGAVNVFDTARH